MYSILVSCIIWNKMIFSLFFIFICLLRSILQNIDELVLKLFEKSNYKIAKSNLFVFTAYYKMSSTTNMKIPQNLKLTYYIQVSKHTFT